MTQAASKQNVCRKIKIGGNFQANQSTMGGKKKQQEIRQQ
jgi:hypothetical protein